MRAEPALGLLLTLPLVVAGCATPKGPSLAKIAEKVNATLEPATIVLAGGDQLEVRFPYAVTWNQIVDVQPDGSASFLGVGRMIVAGMSPGKLRDTLGQSYARVFENPELDVVVKTLGARNVYVMGEVLKPGEIVLGPDRRLSFLDALARAGGPRKESAYLGNTLLVRWSPSTGKQLHWTIDARPETWSGATPLLLQPYDVLYVPNTPVDEVAIWVDNYIRRMIPFPYIIPPVAR